MKRIIEETIETTTKALMTELTKQKMLKPVKDTTFEKIEKLLYNYNAYKQVVQSNFNEIEWIKAEGLSRKSTSLVTIYKSSTGEHLTDLEKAEQRIEEIQDQIERVNQYIDMIDTALSKISDDTYYDLIPMKYFEGLSNDDISIEFDCDVATINRNRKRLINTLKIHLFPEEAITELFFE